MSNLTIAKTNSIPKVKFHLSDHLSQFLQNLGEKFEKHGDTIEINTRFKKIICFRNPKDIEEIYTNKNSGKFKPSFLLPRVQKAMSGGLFINNGKVDWQFKRAEFAKFFQKKNCHLLMDGLAPAFERFKNTTKESSTFYIFDEMRKLTIDYFINTFFGIHLPETELNELTTKTNFLIQHFLDHSPIILPLPSNIKFQIYSSWVKNKIMNYGSIATKNETSVFYKIHQQLRKNSTHEWNINEIASELLSFYFGMGNLSCALSWSIYSLSKHPHIKQRLLNLNGISRNVAKTGDEQSNYRQMIINESLRLFPPAWGFPRIVANPMTINNHTYNKDTILFPLGFFAQRHPNYWERPNDFYPDHFLKNKKIHTGAYYPYGIGPRVCIGAHLANNLMHEIIQKICDLYDFERIGTSPAICQTPLHFGFELMPMDKLSTKFSRKEAHKSIN